MMYTSIECAKAGIAYASVHDSYWTHAASVDKMNKILREQFIKLHKQPIMERLLDEWHNYYTDITDFPPLPKRGELDLDQVATSRYFFN
jgi:DNA-directed RNA polymerase